MRNGHLLYRYIKYRARGLQFAVGGVHEARLIRVGALAQGSSPRVAIERIDPK